MSSPPEAVAAPVAPPAGPGLAPEAQAALDAALEGLQQACAIISSTSPLSEEARRLRPALVLMQHAAAIINTVPDAGQSPTLRWRLYQLIQAQKNGEDAAFYKELRCAIHLGLCGEAGDPVTLPCGHSFCRPCITPVVGSAQAAARKCPSCRVPITLALADLKATVAIKCIVDRLLPQQQPAGGGGGP